MVVLAPPVNGLSNWFPIGQCTYWASKRYQQLTGKYVSWHGDAYTWASGANAQNWTVSSTPPSNIPSIIVLSPFVQGAGNLGHVAVVEHINSDGSVYTSNLNWNGNQTSPTFVTFHPGNGVKFVYFPNAGINSGVSPVTPDSTGVSSSQPSLSFVSQLQNLGQKIGWFIIAVALLIGGVYIIFRKQINEGASTVAKGAIVL